MKKPLIFAIETLVVVGLTFLGWLLPLISLPILRIFANIGTNLLLGASAWVAIKLSGLSVDFEWKNYKQFLIGAGVCLVLSLCIAWIPALCGCSLVGAHQTFVLWKLFFNLFYFLLIIGPVEELIFRVYYQKTLVAFFGARKWIGVILASALFGLWHLINGSWIQVAFTFGIGLAFGFTKEYVKDMHYPGISLCHGLYDFLNYVVTITI